MIALHLHKSEFNTNTAGMDLQKLAFEAETNCLYIISEVFGNGSAFTLVRGDSHEEAIQGYIEDERSRFMADNPDEEEIEHWEELTGYNYGWPVLVPVEVANKFTFHENGWIEIDEDVISLLF